MLRNSIYIITFLCCQYIIAQDNLSLEIFLNSARENAPTLKENENLKEIGVIQNNVIRAQNNAFQVNATSEVLFAPYFNNSGRVIDITTAPSQKAYGYDVGITNGGLYSAQINVSKNLFSQATTDNLLSQNNIKNDAITLSSEEIEHNLIKNITDAYVVAYQLQLQENFTTGILKDLKKQLLVVELLVKRGILQDSDYLLLQLDIENKNLELKQIQNNRGTAINQLYTLSGMNIKRTDSLPKPILFKTNELKKGKHFYERKFTNDSLQVRADQGVFENVYKPQLTAYGNTGLNAIELENMEHKIGLSVGLRLTIPIYDGGQRKYNNQKSKLKENNLEFYKHNAQVELENKLSSIEDQMRSLKENKILLDSQIEKHKSILEIYKGRLVQGQISIIDYLNVIHNYKQNVYTQLQMQTNMWLLQSQYNYINW